MRSGKPPTLWCDLMVTDGPPVNETLSITSGIERALGQELGAADFLGFGLEDFDEEAADGLALGLRIGHSSELSRRTVRGVNVDERDVVLAAEHRDDFLRLRSSASSRDRR